MRHPAHYTPDLLARAQRHLVAKAVAEYTHERLLSPVPDGDDWRLTSPDGRSVLRFRAEVLPLEHWLVDEASLARTVDGEPAELDVQAFVVEHAEALGIPPRMQPLYVEELAATLAAACWKLAHRTETAAELVDADLQTIEAAMTEGHPGFVANNGRIGFSPDDHAAFAPEAGPDVHLLWLAARRSGARLSLGAGLTEARLYDAELDQATRAAFSRVLSDRGLDPADYLWLPLHPWQWRKVAITFAPDLAREDLVLLGEGPDTYRPQQSIRTFYNVSRPDRDYVKTALSVQNMGFVRGLSPAYMAATPAINDWVAQLVESDPELKGCGFTVLREHAAIGWTGDVYHHVEERSPQRKMLAALWRESPAGVAGSGERLATMTSLVHRDAAGDSVVAALIRASGLAPADWVGRYLEAYVRPLVHCLLAHELAFMPHGENLVLVLRDHVVDRVVIKDIGEEVLVMDGRPVPEGVDRVSAEVEMDVRALSLHTDVMDGFLRHLAGILHADGLLDAGSFWGLVAEVVDRHAADHPELAAAAARYDLRRSTFRHSCLNRLQLRNTLQMVDLADQAGSLAYAGQIENPIAQPATRHESSA
ncbi:IucA/IucC family siderophore biosynthesis protein [Nocardioides sp. CFH 31398]|uniref:IucA/IucC family protein n=1 Tax=Nocardioides sp. CFH 31398 TaxID=2919579 RepID=UPI001F05D5B4|nr:IucA/IucC family protein [Nocardioides sp. CFH 31398]MCH1867346.1 IucA/IucC family siderophore biosynthesis protein [Nocardioides sp. CFH 31398]